MRTNQSGATIIEFSLVIGVVLFFVFAIIDIALYFHALTTVREVARRVTKQAVVDNDFATDTRSFTNPSITPSVEATTKISTARQRIVDQAVTLAKSSILAPSFEQGETEYYYSADGYRQPAGQNLKMTALLLRPGEKAVVAKKNPDGTTSVTNLTHPNCINGDPNAALCRQYLRKPGADAWNFMQRNFPYYVEVKADVGTILFGKVEVKAKSLAWKDIAKNSEAGDFVQVPTPLTCSEAHPNPAQVCTANCGAPDACTFYPGNLIPQGCFTCKTCQDFTSADEVCQSCGGAGGDYDETCNFNASGSNANSCGGCQPKTGSCDQYSSADQVCQACGGEDGNATHECQFNEDGQITVGGSTAACGKCVAKMQSCSEATDAETLCQTCGGAEGNTTQECVFKPNQSVPVGANNSRCGGCKDRQCSTIFTGLPSGEIDDNVAAGISECGCNYETQECLFNPGNKYGQGCFGCGAKNCSDYYSADEVREYCDRYELENPGLECVFNPETTNKGSCFGNKTRICSERYTPEQVEEYCNNYEAQNPGRECVFNPNSRDQNCFGGRARTCRESYTAEQIREYCDNYEAQNPGRECVFYGSRATNCFGSQLKTCAERIGEGLINIDQLCEQQCDDETQHCNPVSGRNPTCVSCQPKTCQEAGISQTEVCGECGYGQQCNYDPNGVVGDCGSCQTCPAVNCQEQNGEELDPTGCACRSCVPTECPTGSIIIGCKCVENTPS